MSPTLTSCPASYPASHQASDQTSDPASDPAAAPAATAAPAPRDVHAAHAAHAAPLDADTLRAGVQRRLARALGARRYDLTFTHTARLTVPPPAHADAPATVRAVVPGRFFAQRLRTDYADALRDAVNAELGRPADAPVVLTVCEDPAQFPDAGPPAARAGRAASPAAHRAPARTAPPARQPGQCQGFDAFVVGPSNRMAHAAAWALSGGGDGSGSRSQSDNARTAPDGAADQAYDGPAVLVLHGDCGLGKTHLLLAACQRTRQRRPEARVRYLTGEQFVNQFIEAVRSNTLKSFRAGLRRLDLLAIDDAQFLSNKTKSQQEFLHCFDHIEQNGARVIMATDQHPQNLPSFSAPLISRCVKGLVVQVRPPEADTRRELIDRLARRRGLALRPGVADVVSQNAGASVREIEGAVTRLQAVVSLGAGARRPAGTRVPRTVTLHDAAQLAALDAPARAPRPVRFDQVLTAVTTGMNVSRDQIITGSRQREVVLARGLLVHLGRELTTLSYPEMARALNKKSHSTLVSSRRRFKALLEVNAPLLLTGRPSAITPAQLVETLRAAVLDGAA